MAYVEDADFARIYGDMGTGVWLAPKVATAAELPESIKTDPGATFKAAGWLGEEGIALNIDKETKEFNALQGGKLIKKKTLKVSQVITFVMLEETAQSMGIVFADNPITVSGAGTEIDPKIARQDIATNQTRIVERSMVVDTVEGNIWDRYVIEAADLTFKGEIMLSKNDELRAYKIEATILDGEAYHLTNSPGLLPAV